METHLPPKMSLILIALYNVTNGRIQQTKTDCATKISKRKMFDLD